MPYSLIFKPSLSSNLLFGIHKMYIDGWNLDLKPQLICQLHPREREREREREKQMRWAILFDWRKNFELNFKVPAATWSALSKSWMKEQVCQI